LNIDIQIAKEILLNLLHIYSPSGNEEPIAKYIYDLLIDNNINAELMHISGRSYNIIVNNIEKPKLLIASHMDTISTFFLPKQEENNVISGTGACDAKGSITAMILSLIEEGKNLPKNISFGFFSDEESSGSGSAHYLIAHKPKFSLILEPTKLKICLEGCGSVEGTIFVQTRRIHPAVANKLREKHSILLGINLIKSLSKELSKQGLEFIIYAINAGNKENFFVPDKCEITFNILIPHEKTARDCLYLLRELSSRYNFDFIVNEYSDPFRLQDRGYIEKIENAYRMTFSSEPQYIIMPSWTDANNFAKYNIPTAIFGPGSLSVAHSEYEKIDLHEIISAYRFIKNIIRSFK